MGYSSAYGGTEVTAWGELSNMRLGRTVQLVLTLEGAGVRSSSTMCSLRIEEVFLHRTRENKAHSTRRGGR